MEVYKQFDRATRTVSASALILDGEVVGRIVFTYGPSRTRCYVQAWGSTMVTGYADGSGYDKSTAAFSAAVDRLEADSRDSDNVRVVAMLRSAAVESDKGYSWRAACPDAGFTLANAI